MTTTKKLYLVARIPQVDGGVRTIYARTKSAAREMRAQIDADPAMIDGLPRNAIVIRDEVRP